MKLDADIEWIDLAQDRDRWCGVVNAVTNLRNLSWLTDDLLASQEGLCSRELANQLDKVLENSGTQILILFLICEFNLF